MPKWSVSDMRSILRKLNQTTPADMYNRMNKAALLKELQHSYSKLSVDEIIEEHIPREIYDDINVFVATTVAHVVYGTDNGESVDMIQMLSLHRHSYLLENHEKCSTLFNSSLTTRTFFKQKRMKSSCF